MRTLSTNNLKCQHNGRGTPSFRVYYGPTLINVSRDVFAVDLEEQAYKNMAAIHLDNSDGRYTNFQHHGEEVRIEQGFNGDYTGGELPYFWIENPALYSYRDDISGRLIRVIDCIGVWTKIEGWTYDVAPPTPADPPQYWHIGNGNRTVREILAALFTEMDIPFYAAESEDYLTHNVDYQPLVSISPTEDGITACRRILQHSGCVLKPYLDGARLYYPKPLSIVVGTDDNDYECILDHTSTTSNRPITGTSWATYWKLRTTL